MRLFPVSFTLLALLFLTSVSFASTNKCDQFYSNQPTANYGLWLEKSSPERTAWVREQSGKTLRTLHDSDNYTTISNTVLSFNSSVRTLSVDGNKDANYYLRFMGLNKQQSIIRSSSRGNEEIITTDMIKKDTSFSLLKAYATPKDTHLILMASDNGNIDVFQMYLYDLKEKKVIRQWESRQTEISWKSDKEFFFIDFSKRTETETNPELKVYNLETNTVSVAKNQNIQFVDNTSFAEYDPKSNSYFLKMKDKPKIVLPKDHANSGMSISSLKELSSGEVILHAQDSWENISKVLRYNPKGKPRWQLINANGPKEVVSYVEMHDKYMEINSFWGASTVSKFYDYHGKELFSVNAPECCAISTVDYIEGQDVITVRVSSHFKQHVPFKYSLKEKRFLDPTLQKQMMSIDGKDYTSSIHWAKSKDGTKVPVRLTYRKDLEKNKRNGLLIYGYGGFMLPGYINSRDPLMDAFFIKNGGVIASPALRGGNEFGKPWHESAMLENKFKTIEDVAATAELVHSMGLSSRDYTAFQGWSNGGFVASAVGLLHSNIIGIIISGNGVNDQLRKETLDPYFGPGWMYEYGDARKKAVAEYLKQWSSVFRAQLSNPTPEMLIINGRLDSRVNSAHSIKLAYALLHHSTTPEKVHLLSIPNSGHWMTSVAYQNTIAWKSQTLIWTFLFDKMGMTASL